VGGTWNTHGKGEKCLQGFGWEVEVKRPLGRRRRRWKNNINLGLRDIWIDVAN
jgi:hypothetical protein